MDIPVVVI